MRVHEPFTVTLENCTASLERTEAHTETLSLPPDYALALPEPLQAEAGVVAAAVRALYGLGEGRDVSGQVRLAAPPAARVAYRLHWEEMWDENTLHVRRGNEMVASLAVSAPIGARLVTETVHIEKCTMPQMPGITGPSVEAEAPAVLVRSYLEHLSAQDYEDAYALLTADYRQRVPFDRYLEGYEPVAELKVEAIQTTHIEPAYAVVEARLVLGLRRQGQIVSSPWLGTYYLVRQAAGESWAWAIADVVMLPLVPMLTP